MSRGQKLFVAVAILVGLLARLSGIIADEARVFQQFPTEDGYFMLSIARNLATGNGFSVAGGAMPTNGTQPLTTLIWSIPFWIAGGDRALGVRLTLVLELLGSCAAGYMVYRVGRRVLTTRRGSKSIATIAAAIWFVSPICVQHSMNTLETGFNALTALVVAYVFIDPDGPTDRVWSFAKSVAVGVLLGVAFWMRNDSVFVILAACLTYVIGGVSFGIPAMTKRLGRSIIFGLVSIVTASPWLAYNYIEFGHIMPVSGRAESLTRHAGGNLYDLPSVVLEYVMGLVPIPEAIEVLPVTVWTTAAIVVAIFVFVGPRVWRASSPQERTLIIFTGIYGACLCVFYGLVFGAGWFMSRYLFPLGGFFVIAFAAIVLHYLPRIGGGAVAAGAVFVVAMTGVNVRTYLNGTSHPHFQVVAFAREHVPEPMWVGAVQTGTLGFFHDRTINLDGKVNIAAYESLIEHRKGRYVEDGRIEMLIDWAGMVTWLEMPIIDANFRELLHDEKSNLGVLERKDRRRFEQRLEPDKRVRKVLLERFQEALLDDGLDNIVRARLHVYLATLMRIEGTHTAAILQTKKAIAAIGDRRAPALRATALLLQGDSLRVRRDRPAAAKAYQSALDALVDSGDETRALRADIWHAIAETRRLDGNKDGALAAIEEASKLDTTKRERATTLMIRADLLRDSGDEADAKTAYERTYNLRENPTDAMGDRDLSLAETRIGRLIWDTDAEHARALVVDGVERRAKRAPPRGRPPETTASLLSIGAAILTSTTSTITAL